MRILHFGGITQITRAMAAYQARLGNDVVIEADKTLSSVLQSHAQGFDVVHVHQSLGKLDEESDLSTLRAALSESKKSGGKFVYYAYGRDASREQSAGATQLKTLLHECFDHIFIGTPDSLNLSHTSPSWSWLSIGIDIGNILAPQSYEPHQPELRVLFLSEDDAGLAAWQKKAHTLLERGLHLELSTLGGAETQNQNTLRTRLMQCDLVIEYNHAQSYGYFAVEAMAHGKTVLSGNPPLAQEQWQQLMFCPVLDTNHDNLLKRLESVVKEPKCLRDLGKRSRLYAEQYHNAEISAALALNVYERLLSR